MELSSFILSLSKGIFKLAYLLKKLTCLLFHCKTQNYNQKTNINNSKKYTLVFESIIWNHHNFCQIIWSLYYLCICRIILWYLYSIFVNSSTLLQLFNSQYYIHSGFSFWCCHLSSKLEAMIKYIEIINGAWKYFL